MSVSTVGGTAAVAARRSGTELACPDERIGERPVLEGATPAAGAVGAGCTDGTVVPTLVGAGLAGLEPPVPEPGATAAAVEGELEAVVTAVTVVVVVDVLVVEVVVVDWVTWKGAELLALTDPNVFRLWATT